MCIHPDQALSNQNHPSFTLAQISVMVDLKEENKRQARGITVLTTRVVCHLLTGTGWQAAALCLPRVAVFLT